MVDLIGEAGDIAQEVLKDLHIGIDSGKKIATDIHNFEIKLTAIDNVIMHVDFNYSEHEDLYNFFIEISDEIVSLREELESLEKGDIHIVLEEESAAKKGAAYVFKHRKMVEDKLESEAGVDEVIIKKVHQAFLKLKDKFYQVENLFSIDIEKATVKEVKIELKETEEQMKHILEKLLGFFVAYEKVFLEELKRLEAQ